MSSSPGDVGLFSTVSDSASCATSSRCARVSFFGICTRPYHQIAASLFVQIRNTAPAHTELFPALRAFRNLQRHRAIDPRNLDLRAQRRLRKADRDHAMQIVSFALKEVVRANREHNVQIAARSA